MCPIMACVLLFGVFVRAWNLLNMDKLRIPRSLESHFRSQVGLYLALISVAER